MRIVAARRQRLLERGEAPDAISAATRRERGSELGLTQGSVVLRPFG
jgi:hypothetical protein